MIHPGDAIVVPEGGHAARTAPDRRAAVPCAAPSSCGAVHRRRPTWSQNGDYLFGIAADHGVTVGALLKANELKITSTITPGQTLAIPPRTIPLPVDKPAPLRLPRTAGTRDCSSTCRTGDARSCLRRGTDAGRDPAPAAAPVAVDTVIAYLQQQIGKPYKFNTAGPDTFDCSGLVRAAFLQVGVRLPHYSLLQSTYGTAVDWTTEPIRPGDLVFTFSSASPQEIGHVGIAIDSRRWIQAAGTGDVRRDRHAAEAHPGRSPHPLTDRVSPVPTPQPARSVSRARGAWPADVRSDVRRRSRRRR